MPVIHIVEDSSGSEARSGGEYEGSDWDEAIKQEIDEEEQAAKQAKGQKRKRKPATSSSGKKSSGATSAGRAKGSSEPRKLPAILKEEMPEPPPRIPRRAGKLFGPKWFPLPDGRYQYIHDSDETVSGNEDKNPLWDLLGMDRQGRLVQPLKENPSNTDEGSVTEDEEPFDSMARVEQEFPSVLAIKAELDTERSLEGEAPPGLNVSRQMSAETNEDIKGTSFAGGRDAGSDSDSDLSADERIKRKRARLRRAPKPAVKLEPQSSAVLHHGSSSTASAAVLVSSDSDGDKSGSASNARGGKGSKSRTLSRPTWWGRDDVEELPEEQLLPRPAFPCPDEVKRTTGPLFLGKDENGKAIQVPKTINCFLRDYQREGIKFFYSCYAEKRGGILGDDMGLGKTCQTISFLAAIMDKKGFGQFDQHRRKTAVESNQPTPWPVALVICPNSVVENWSREFDMWGWFEWKVMDSKNFRQVLTDFEHGRLDVIIATHDFIARHIEELQRIPFGCIVVDEVHRVKNADAARTKAYKSFDCQIRFGLTGTAVQNDFNELHTILDWSNPGRVGNKRQWDRTINLPLQRLLDKSQTDQDTHDEHLLRIAFIQRLLPKFYLRRDKRIIADQMPVKRDFLIFCSLTEEQVVVYQRLLHFYRVENFKVAMDPCGCGRRDPKTGTRLKVAQCCWPTSQLRRMLMWITIIKQASDHLALLYYDPEDNVPNDAVKYAKFVKQREICKVMYPNAWEEKRCTVIQGLRSDLCGKWTVLENLLREWQRAGDKILLFSQNLRLLRWLEDLVKLGGFVYRRLDGTTPQALRQSFVDDFNYTPEITVFLISTMAGGVGLNLTAANKVVIFDPHWNPAVDQQAQDRAYRIGQTRDVDVYRMVGSGSLEERIFRRQIHKQQLANLAYGEEKQDRIFSGMHGVHDSNGDLWGLSNLFTFEPRKVPASGLIEAVDLEEAEAFAEEIEAVIKTKAEAKSADPEKSKGRGKGKGKAKAKGKARGKGKRRDGGDTSEEDEGPIVLDPMEALIVREQALGQAESETEDGDEDIAAALLAARKAKAGDSHKGLGDRMGSLRHDQIIVPQGSEALAQAGKQALRRLDDVPTIEHHEKTIIVGRPRLPQPKSGGKKKQSSTQDSSYARTAGLLAATTLAMDGAGSGGSGSGTLALPSAGTASASSTQLAAESQAYTLAQAAAAAAATAAGPPSSPTQPSTQSGPTQQPTQGETLGEEPSSSLGMSQSQPIKSTARWQPPANRGGGGGGTGRGQHRVPRF